MDSPFMLRVRRGDIWKAEAEGAEPRFVYVAGDVDDHGVVQIYLISNEVDFGSTEDVLLTKADSGLPFALLIETDMEAPIWEHQLVQKIGAVPFPAHLKPSTPTFLPIKGRSDPRWEWKLDELKVLQALCRDCVCAELGDED